MDTSGETSSGCKRNQSSYPDNLESTTIQMPTGTTSPGFVTSHWMGWDDDDDDPDEGDFYGGGY